MRVIGIGLLIATVVGAAWFIWWFGWGRLTVGPPEAVVEEFLDAVRAKDWSTAEAYMTIHVRGRLGREGFGAMQRFVESRLEPFTTFQIVRVTPRGQEVNVFVRLLLPVPADQPQVSAAPLVGLHGTPGRIEGTNFVHAHRFQLQQQDRGAWRIYQFEEVDERS